MKNRKWARSTTCSSRSERQPCAPDSTTPAGMEPGIVFATGGKNMHGDFTRDTFDPAKNYSRVLMQQGRVALDADWNEQTSILLRYLRLLTRDIFGPHAGPSGNIGFEIIANLTDQPLKDKLAKLLPGDCKRREELEKPLLPGEMRTGRGRYSVDGLPVENHEPILYGEQPGAPFGDDVKPTELKTFKGRLLFYLDVWEP